MVTSYEDTTQSVVKLLCQACCRGYSWVTVLTTHPPDAKYAVCTEKISLYSISQACSSFCMIHTQHCPHYTHVLNFCHVNVVNSSSVIVVIIVINQCNSIDLMLFSDKITLGRWDLQSKWKFDWYWKWLQIKESVNDNITKHTVCVHSILILFKLYKTVAVVGEDI